MHPAILYIVVPCYNEEEVLPLTSDLLLQELEALGRRGLADAAGSTILLVDDGSSDGTWGVICELAQRDHRFAGIRQSRNRGHQNALIAGLAEARGRCDAAITIDADGQDDVGAMEQMLVEYLGGCDVVYGVRSSRDTDTLFKRASAGAFYKLVNAVGGEVVPDHADYRLLSGRAIEALSEFEEVNLFLRGMVPLVGFKSTSVYYERQKRLAGSSRYSLPKMASLALDGITSLSIRPIRVVTTMGLAVSVLSLVGIVWAIVTKLSGHAVDGWASMACILLFVAGVQLVSLGVIGEYVGKTYLEAKHRPRYIISDRVGSAAPRSERPEQTF